jgi:hypothetical protein
MAKSHRRRKHIKISRKISNGKRRTLRKRATRRNRNGGNDPLSMGSVSSGLGAAKNNMAGAYNTRFGKTQALNAAGRSNAGVVNANQYGSQTLISTTAPTMPRQ